MRAMPLLRLPRLLVLAFALLLLGGQQAALAHMLGHALGELSQTREAGRNGLESGDEEHGAALSLSHVCTTCIALDAFSALPPHVLRPDFAGSAVAVVPAPTFSVVLPTLLRRYAARAPPLTL